MRGTGVGTSADTARTSARATKGAGVTVLVAIAISGLTALGAEVVWTRLLSLLLGATVYTFSIILAVFLIGVGIGSSAASMLAAGVRPRADARRGRPVRGGRAAGRAGRREPERPR